MYILFRVVYIHKHFTNLYKHLLHKPLTNKGLHKHLHTLHKHLHTDATQNNNVILDVYTSDKDLLVRERKMEQKMKRELSEYLHTKI